jgi:HEAT repeat protein
MKTGRIWAGIILGGLIVLGLIMKAVDGIVLRSRMARMRKGGGDGKAAADSIVAAGDRFVFELASRIEKRGDSEQVAFSLLVRIETSGAKVNLKRLFGSPQTVAGAVEAGEAAVPFLVSLAESGTSSQKVAAVEALAAIGGPAAWKGLASMLTSGEKEVVQAAQAACIAAGEAILPHLEYPLRRSDENGAGAAARVIQGIGGPKAFAALVNSVGGITSAAVVKALGDSGNPEAVPPLIKLLSSYDFYVRIAAAEALGKLKDKRALDDLVRKIDDFPSTYLEAIESIGGQAAVDALAREFQRFGSEKVAESLFRINPDRASEILGKRAENGNQSAGIFLAKRGDARGLRALLHALAAGSGTTRKEAAELLVRLYRDGKLDDEAKKELLQLRAKIQDSHADYVNKHKDSILTYNPSDCSDLHRGDHEDVPSEHRDTGIGVKFDV